MSQDSGGDSRQRTVAELLAQYGESGTAAAPKRRRRRAEDDAEETAPQAIIDRVLSDSGRMRPVTENGEPPRGRAEQAPVPRRRPPQPPAAGQSTAQNPPVQPPVPQAPVHQPPPAPPESEQPTATQQPISQSAAERASRARRMTSRFSPVQGAAPGGAEATSQQPPVAPPGTGTFPPARPQDTQRRAPVPPAEQHAEPLTEQLPPVQAEPEAPRRGEPPAGLGPRQPSMRAAPVEPDSTGEQTQYGMPALDDDEDDSSYAGVGQLDGTDDAEYADADYDDGDYDDEDDDESTAADGPASRRDWLVLVGLGAAGVVGGALVWLGFNWLWGSLPQVALIPALAVIGGMVWIVRRVRNDDDLQTTVLSVLVGLVVTVSPAAFLLLDR